ncbi:putative bifunctional diguanylate cyclase/phosphodiesterase [Sphingomonas xanthus]|uniref:putative bifunctional diguanylate cyclase/phosphodiesterase n=1 Tax=Sphingomonas xanthus TaxID=2594473 RepID=UPI00164D3D88|nr:EAL domain-containing protein [Sphingomonas xanthus]
MIGVEGALRNSDYTGGTVAGAVFFTIIVARMAHWYRIRHKTLSVSEIQAHLKKSFILSSCVTLLFTAWCVSIFLQLPLPMSLVAPLFVGMFGIGACYGLINFPAAAHAVIYCTLAPFIVLLSISGGILEISIAFSFIAALAMMTRTIAAHDAAFVKLVRSNIDTERERSRALAAENEALLEKTRVAQIARTDALTGLLNRRGFLSQLDQIAPSAQTVGIAIFDLDGFKPINDTYGHLAGDALLKDVATRLCGLVGEASVFRLGGDEFAILRPNLSIDEIQALALEAIKEIDTPFTSDGRRMTVTACAGVAACPMPESSSEIMRMADLALYIAKGHGRGQVQCFTEDVRYQVERRTLIEQALREPNITEQIDVAYQPIFDLQRMEVASFEALARWRHSELGWISPAEFIPITEQISIIEPLSEALLAKACRDTLKWPNPVKLSFNLSPCQICSTDAADQIINVVKASGLDPSRIQIEVTETALLSDFDAARRCISKLRESNMQIALDDFGSGYASITYLREIRFDCVKMDGSLVRSLIHNPDSLPLISGVLALCQSIGVPCVAEHIETDLQLNALQSLGCRYGQGFLLSQPLQAREAQRFSGLFAVDGFEKIAV